MNDVTAGSRPTRILIVDDDELSGEVLTQLLRLIGHEPVAERDGDRAVARALAEPFDLLLLDLSMPGLDGFEVLRRLHSARTPPAVPPAIAVTGWIGERDRALCRAAGFSGHLNKPVQLAELQAAIDRALGAATALGGGPVADAGDADRLRETAVRLERLTPGDEGFSPTAVEAFALRSAQLIDSLRRAIDETDVTRTQREAQMLEDGARFLGASRLAACAAAIGRHGAAADWAQARAAVQDFEQQHQAVLTVLFGIDR